LSTSFPLRAAKELKIYAGQVESCVCFFHVALQPFVGAESATKFIVDFRCIKHLPSTSPHFSSLAQCGELQISLKHGTKSEGKNSDTEFITLTTPLARCVCFGPNILGFKDGGEAGAKANEK
jgi:hypothetical protein